MSRTVVLCGSLGATSAMWLPQLPVLDGSLVVAVEHPGHGGAPVADVETVGDLAARVLERVRAETFSFVGLSLGGAVGMRLAIDSPERVEKLVLCCTAPRFGEPEQWRERAATVRAEGLSALVDAVMPRWFTPGFPAAGAFREMFLSVDPEGYARCCDALASWDVRSELGSIVAPTLVISGSEDPVTPPSVMEELASGIAGARFGVIEHAAHLANVEQPDLFNRLLEEFL